MELASWLIWIWIFRVPKNKFRSVERISFFSLSLSLYSNVSIELKWHWLFFIIYSYEISLFSLEIPFFLVFRYLSLCLVWWKKKYSKRIDRRIDQVHLYCTIIWNEFCFFLFFIIQYLNEYFNSEEKNSNLFGKKLNCQNSISDLRKKPETSL